MSTRRVSVGLILALPLCSCVPLVPPAQLALPHAYPDPDADQAIDRTRRAFTQAAQSGDVQEMARFFTPDGMVITGNGDTVRGREALAQFFVSGRATPITAVLHFGQFSRESHLQKCSDGVNERGRFHESQTLSGPYAVRWEWDSLGGAQIQRIVFAQQAAIHRIGPSGCYIPVHVRQQSKRIVVSVFGIMGSGTSPARGVESAMRQQGWAGGGDLTLLCPSWDHCTYHSTPWTHEETSNPFHRPLGIVSYRFSPSLATEVMHGDRPSGSTIGLDSAGTTQLEAIWWGYFDAAAVTYERFGFHVGFGPALERMKWRLVRANPYNTNLRSETSGQVKPYGLIVEVGYHRAVVGPVRLDVVAQLRRFGKVTLPGGATYLNSPIVDNTGFIDLGLGMVF